MVLDQRVVYRIPIHTLLDIALFFGSDDLLNVRARHLMHELKYMNASRVLVAIATHSMTPDLIRQGRLSDALLEAFDATRKAFLADLPELVCLTNEQLFLRIRSTQAEALGFRGFGLPPTPRATRGSAPVLFQSVYRSHSITFPVTTGYEAQAPTRTPP